MHDFIINTINNGDPEYKKNNTTLSRKATVVVGTFLNRLRNVETF